MVFSGVLIWVPRAGELTFIDLDEHNLKFFVLCAHLVAGALPLGNISKIFFFKLQWRSKNNEILEK